MRTPPAAVPIGLFAVVLFAPQGASGAVAPAASPVQSTPDAQTTVANLLNGAVDEFTPGIVVAFAHGGDVEILQGRRCVGPPGR